MRSFCLINTALNLINRRYGLLKQFMEYYPRG